MVNPIIPDPSENVDHYRNKPIYNVMPEDKQYIDGLPASDPTMAEQAPTYFPASEGVSLDISAPSFFSVDEFNSIPSMDIAKDKAQRYDFALAETSPGEDWFLDQVMSGQEDNSRREMSMQERINLNQKRAKLAQTYLQNLPKGEVTSDVIDQIYSLDRDTVDEAQTDPATFYERKFARKSADIKTSDVSLEDAQQTATIRDTINKIGDDIGTKQQLARSLFEYAQSIHREQSWGEFGLSLLPFYTYNALTSTLKQDPGSFMGEKVKNQIHNAWTMSTSDFLNKNKAYIEELNKKDPNLALQYASALLGYSATQEFQDNLQTYFDITVLPTGITGATIKGLTFKLPGIETAKALGKTAIHAPLEYYANLKLLNAVNSMKTMYKNGAKTKVDYLSMLPEARQAHAAAVESIRNRVARTGQQSDWADMEMIVQDIINPSRILTGGTNMTAEEAARIEISLLKSSTNALEQIISKPRRLSRLSLDEAGLARSEAELFADRLYSNTTIGSRVVKIAGFNSYMPATETLGGTDMIAIYIGTKNASGYATAGSAKGAAKKLGLGKFDVEEVDGLHYIRVTQPVSEVETTMRAFRDPSNKAADRNHIPIIHGIMSRIRMRDSLIPEQLAEDFKYTQSATNAYFDANRKQFISDFSGLNKQSRADLDNFLSIQRDFREQTGPTYKNDVVRGKYSHTVGEFQNWWQKIYNRLPTVEETKAYFSWKNWNDVDYAVRNLDLYRDMTRLGIRDISLRFRGPDGNFTWFENLEGKILTEFPWDRKGSAVILEWDAAEPINSIKHNTRFMPETTNRSFKPVGGGDVKAKIIYGKDYIDERLASGGYRLIHLSPHAKKRLGDQLRAMSPTGGNPLEPITNTIDEPLTSVVQPGEMYGPPAPKIPIRSQTEQYFIDQAGGIDAWKKQIQELRAQLRNKQIPQEGEKESWVYTNMTSEDKIKKMTDQRVRTENIYQNSKKAVMEPSPYSDFNRMAAKLPDEVNQRFQVHGILGTSDKSPEQLLDELLTKGIRTDQVLHSGPPRGGTSGVDSTRTFGAPYLILSDPDKTLVETGVKYVVINTPDAGILSNIKQMYPGVHFFSVAQAEKFLTKGIKAKGSMIKPPKSITPGSLRDNLKNFKSEGSTSPWAPTAQVDDIVSRRRQFNIEMEEYFQKAERGEISDDAYHAELKALQVKYKLSDSDMAVTANISKADLGLENLIDNLKSPGATPEQEAAAMEVLRKAVGLSEKQMNKFERELNKLKTREERQALWNSYVGKKIELTVTPSNKPNKIDSAGGYGIGDEVYPLSADGSKLTAKPEKIVAIWEDPKFGTYVQTEGQAGMVPIEQLEMVSKKAIEAPTAPLEEAGREVQALVPDQPPEVPVASREPWDPKHYDYILVRMEEDMKEQSLGFIRFPYQEGGHKLDMDSYFFIRQPEIYEYKSNLTTYNKYEGDINAYSATLESEAKAFNDRLNQIRDLLAKGNTKEAELFYVKYLDGVSKNFKEFTKQFKELNEHGHLSLKHAFVVTPRNKSTWDYIRPDIKDNKGNLTYPNLENARDSEHNLFHNELNLQFALQRSDNLERVIRKGSADYPVFGSEIPSNLSPMSTLINTHSDMLRGRVIDDLKIKSAENFGKAYASVVDADPKLVRRDPMYYILNPQWKKGLQGDDLKLLNNAKDYRRALIDFLGVENQTRDYMMQVQRTVADTIKERLGIKSEWIDRHLMRSGYYDPVRWANNAVFDLFFGMFNIKQLAVQAMTSFHTTAVLGPKIGLQAGFASHLARWVLYQNNPARETYLAKVASKALGIKQEHFLEGLKAYRDSGFHIIGAETAMQDDFINQSIKEGWVQNARNYGRVLFKEGDRYARGTGFFGAYLEWRAANPAAKLDTRKIAELINRADTLTLNMTAASNSMLASGSMAIPLKFTTYYARLMEQLMPGWTGSKLTPTERLRAYATYGAMFGIPVTTGGIVGIWPIYKEVEKYLIDNGYDTNEDLVVKAFNEGMAGLLPSLVGIDHNFSEALGPTGSSWLYDIVNGKSPIFDVVTGVGGTKLEETFENSWPFFTLMANIFRTDDQKYPLAQEDFENFIRSFASVNNLWRSIQMYNLGSYMSRNGTPLSRDVGISDSFFNLMLGSQPKELSRAFIMGDMIRATEEMKRSARKEIVKYHRLYLKSLSNDDLESANNYAKIIKGHIVANGFTPQELNGLFSDTIARNKDMVTFTEKKFYESTPERMKLYFDKIRGKDEQNGQ